MVSNNIKKTFLDVGMLNCSPEKGHSTVDCTLYSKQHPQENVSGLYDVVVNVNDFEHVYQGLGYIYNTYPSKNARDGATMTCHLVEIDVHGRKADLLKCEEFIPLTVEDFQREFSE